MSVRPSSPSSSRRRGISKSFRSLGGLRVHWPGLLVFVAGALASLAALVWLRARANQERRAVFDREATLVVSNLRSALERPLEVLETSAALFEASEEVTRAEFGSFVKPALERHPGVRALEWIPIVPHSERRPFEERARADGLLGFEFRERNDTGAMVTAAERANYLPIYFMEPGHPLVLGFDCSSDSERAATAERARQSGATVASERIQLLDDPVSVYSIVAFRPVHAPRKPRSPENVLGFTCEVFRVRAVAEHAINDSLRRGIEVALFDPSAAPNKRLLFESTERGARSERGPRFESAIQYADRKWRLVLSARPDYASNLSNAAGLTLLAGLIGSALVALSISTLRLTNHLRRQVRAAQKLGQYTVLEKLGEGGGGVVHKAQHALLRRPTAIKLLHEASGDARTLSRFEREVQLTSELTHPNTIAIYDYGRTPEGIFYYAMEYIDGVDLERLVEQEGRLPPARVVHLLKQACSALAEAHAIGLIHRDIKPANLMVCQRGGIPDFLKVMDFGLVKSIAPAQTELAITESAGTTIVGTPLYLAPETISGSQNAGALSDIYALGAVAYFLLVGEPVFLGQTVVEICTRHLWSEPVPPSERSGVELPVALEAIVLRCLKKPPDQRFGSMTELLAALEQVSTLVPWDAEAAREWWARWHARRAPASDAQRQAAASTS